MSKGNKRCLEILKSLKKIFNSKNIIERHGSIAGFCCLFSEWEGPYPNLRGIFQPEEIDWLLTATLETSHYLDKDVIRFVAFSGYRDEPIVDKDGKPWSYRTTAIHRAARLGYQPVLCESIDYLFVIYNRFDVNYTDWSGLTHFHVACMFGCDYVVERYLELGQDPNRLVPETGDSPLHLALANDHVLMESLLRGGADPMKAGAKGSIPLYLICEDNVRVKASRWDGIPIGLRIKRRENKHESPRRREARRNRICLVLNRQFKTAEVLLRLGANPNLADSNGSTPLDSIYNRGDDKFLKIIFEICDEVNRVVLVDARNKLGQTRLSFALKHNHKKVAELLLRQGANPNLADEDGTTPLRLICAEEDDEFLKIFFEITDANHLQVQVDAQDQLGRTSLQWAVANILPNVVDILLDHGANMSRFTFPTNGYFAKSWSLWPVLKLASGTLAIVESLEKRGYEMNRSDALTIMKAFSQWKLFDKSVNFELRLSDEESMNKAKELSEKLFTYEDYFKFASSDPLSKFPYQSREACSEHLCEILTREFLRSWALDFFSELTNYRLPILCCEKIIDLLKNEDLLGMCLATEIVSKE